MQYQKVRIQYAGSCQLQRCIPDEPYTMLELNSRNSLLELEDEMSIGLYSRLVLSGAAVCNAHATRSVTWDRDVRHRLLLTYLPYAILYFMGRNYR
jgi:hypothetical protein